MSDVAPSSRGPYRNGLRRREQIVRAASQVFAEFGYAGGSIRSIANRIGASPATLLQHFGSKEGLLFAVLEDWDQQTAQAGRRPGKTGLDFFRTFPDVMRFHVQHRRPLELFLTMATEATSPSHPARDFIQRRYAENVSRWGDQLRAAVKAGDIQPMSKARMESEVRMLIAILDGVELQWLLNPSVDLPGTVATYIEDAITRWQQ